MKLGGVKQIGFGRVGGKVRKEERGSQISMREERDRGETDKEHITIQDKGIGDEVGRRSQQLMV